MARIRTIKPDFFRDEDLQDVEAAHPGKYTMLVFAGLWGHCDKAGRFRWLPRTLKLDILPFLQFDMDETLGILQEAGFVRRYEVGGKVYGVIPTFAQHQRIGGKEAQEPERFPAPPSEEKQKRARKSKETPEAQSGSSGEATGKQPPAQEEEGNGERERKGREVAATAPPSASPEPEVQKVQNVSRETIELPADPLKADDELVDDAPPTTVARRGTRLPVDWMPSAEDIAFCRTHRSDLDPSRVADEFRDWWIAKAGSGGVKLDWHATWRTWVRRQNAVKIPAFRSRDDDRAETIRQLRAGEI